ncbi:MAG: M15 family metallopeptidase [Proteobacteria bacterium]|nr:M15 family metallopeptidase [Pseudomonadota bacterium]
MSNKQAHEFRQLRQISNSPRLPLSALLLCLALTASAANESGDLHRDFVDIQQAIPGIEIDVRYFGEDNFIGAPVDGYSAAIVYLTRAAANALGSVQKQLSQIGLGLKVFDGYRPQMAVDHFVRWARDLDDTKMKQRYYPAVDKENLFRDGYIAERSGHSRGSTVDLTIITLASDEELDMGTGWDFFDVMSWPSSTRVTAAQAANRMRLRTIMLENGFKPLQEEWWHFTLGNEPFPDRYFEFEIVKGALD